MIKAAIFDLNGIFLQSPKLSDRFEKDFNISNSLFLPKLKEIMEEVRKPNAKPAFSYWSSVFKEWKVELTESKFWDYWFKGEIQSDRMIQYAKSLKEKGIKAEYLHSEIKTIERIQILTQFRKGEIDILVGVNLLREGLDLPELALIGILDADKEGFLRSETSLIQTIGRAARNLEGKVILYADVMTGSLERAIDETNRRRAIQVAYNIKNNITPKTIIKKIKDITEELENKHEKAVNAELDLDVELFKKSFAKDKNKKSKTEKDSISNLLLPDDERNKLVYNKIINIKEKEMNKAVKELDFETAAILRDEIMILKRKIEN